MGHLKIILIHEVGFEILNIAARDKSNSRGTNIAGG